MAIAYSTTVSAFIREDPHNRDTCAITPAFTDITLGTIDEKAPEAGSNPETSATPSRPYSGWKWFLVCIAIYSAALLYGLDTTIVADIQPQVIETFGAVEKLGWLGIGFPLGSISTVLPLGKIYSIWDVKIVFIASLVMFEASSALCGGANSMDALIVGRVLAGAGGAGMYLGILNLVSNNTSLRERPTYLSISGFTWGVGSILGPLIGGAFADSGASWRWSFYVNLVFFGLCAPIYFFVLNSYEHQPGLRFAAKLGQLDCLGMLLNASMFVFLVMAVTLGSTTWGWTAGVTIALFALSGVSLTAFAVQQRFCILTTPENRLFPMDFLLRRSLILIFVATSSSTAALFIPVYYIPLYFSFVHGDSAIETAIRLLPFVFVMIACSLLNGLLMPATGYYMPWYLASGIFVTIGGSLMYALVDVDTPDSYIYGFSVLIAIGCGLTSQLGYSIAAGKVHQSRITDAIGFINCSQLASVVIALTITSTIFQTIGYRHIEEAVRDLNISPEEMRAGLSGSKSYLLQGASPEVAQKVVAGIVSAIADAYILVIAGGVILLISSLSMRRERLFLKPTAI